MIEKLKENIWQQLKDKEVSLAMIFDDQGEIIWQRGRKIQATGRLARGCGYCSSQARRVLREKSRSVRSRCLATYSDLYDQESAHMLSIKSLVILPVGTHFFLYLDSGTKEAFTEQEIAVFDSLGGLLGELLQNLQNEARQTGGISGSSPQVETMRDKVVRFAIEEEPVLLLGETGVGKSHVAEMIHTFSGRSGPFIVVNTPGIPDTLLESQLFGHRKGSFSGAVADTDGFVAAAEKGTLLLDEIAEIEPALQAKLLRFIDTQKYRRLGETEEHKANVRILTATNRDLKAMIADKTFREDLFFRLNGLTIHIPPLRERLQDLQTLLDEHQSLLRGKQLTKQALAILLGYHWPGNIRELIQVLKVAGIQFKGAEIGAEIRELLAFDDSEPKMVEAHKVELIWAALKAGQPFWQAVKDPFLKRDINRQDVKEIIARGLCECGGKYTQLARLFNLDDHDYHNFMRFLHENFLK
jgi:transcriptional regulator with PAS, ATPase and Fis domain